MDMRKTAREIGFFETAFNLSKFHDSADIFQKVGASMPLPDESIANRIHNVAEWLIGFGKRKLMFLTPEIALVEEISKQSVRETEVIFVIPCDLDVETKERLKNNLPRGIEITILEEPFFPQGFLPENGLMIACGYSASDRAMVLPDTYRMLDHYSGFHGKKVFVPYTEIDIAARYDGWIEVSQQKLCKKWRNDS